MEKWHKKKKKIQLQNKPTCGLVMTSYGFGGAVVNVRVLHWHVGGACGDGPMGALLPGLEEAVGEDRQQSQDGHRQKNSQRYVPWGDSEVTSCQLTQQNVTVDKMYWCLISLMKVFLTWVTFFFCLETLKQPFEVHASLCRHTNTQYFILQQMYSSTTS